jgi:phenylpropionate dioxygenase-like ring-hydroxylating dioxygenase large terminal subunit
MPDLGQHLGPPAVRGHLSVARLPNYWYVACRSKQLGKKPLRRVLMGIPLALFRGGAGGVAAFLDRCPHRNARLSMGRVLASDRLECRYHGWQFDPTGACRHVPGLAAGGESEGRRVDAYPVLERDGLVWVYMTPNVQPGVQPFPLPLASDPRYTTVARELEVRASIHATAENALDVPHTAFLHRGLFRGHGEPNAIEVEVRRWKDRVEAAYLGEPRPSGLAGRLLSPSGGVVEHWDRFILPSVAQVEYRLGPENHILVTALLTPVSDFFTRIFAVVSFRVRIPGVLLRPFLTPLALRIFRQDAQVLEEQTEQIRAFGGERFMSTDADVLGREIWRLMKQAEKAGDASAGDEPVVRRLRLVI